jgi:NADH-quinone oxidoreductase subunit M
LFGSVLMLLAILALYFSTDPHTFDMRIMMAQANKYSTQVIPMWPFSAALGLSARDLDGALHRLCHQDSGVPVSYLVTRCPTSKHRRRFLSFLPGVLLKMGTYGILRTNFPMLPAATADMAYWCLGALGAGILFTARFARWRRRISKNWSLIRASVTWVM